MAVLDSRSFRLSSDNVPKNEINILIIILKFKYWKTLTTFPYHNKKIISNGLLSEITPL